MVYSITNEITSTLHVSKKVLFPKLIVYLSKYLNKKSPCFMLNASILLNIVVLVYICRLTVRQKYEINQVFLKHFQSCKDETCFFCLKLDLNK